MNEGVTWRSYLGEILLQLGKDEKDALYDAVGVNRVSFQRWRSGENTPDARHAQKLLDAVPSRYRERLRTLMLADPKVRRLFPSEDSEQTEEETSSRGRIPGRIYEKVLRTARDSADRFWILSEQIMASALNQLETKPQHTGLEIMVARCMPPRENGKIRSLRAYVGRGTGLWQSALHLKDYFLGGESIAGYAVMQRHGVMVPDLETTILIPTRNTEGARSAVAYPIMREGRTAGALVVSATQANYFSEEMLTLIENYADLIREAFYDAEFFLSSAIDLGLMPPRQAQSVYLSTFQDRVTAEYKRSIREGLSLTELTQVELRVRELLEGELLRIGSSSDETVEV